MSDDSEQDISALPTRENISPESASTSAQHGAFKGSGTKLHSFNGSKQGQTVTEFVSKFETFATVMGWPKDQWAGQLKE